jgi:hypothetical protein
MATPVVAGAAALARQYFAGGWYPAGAPQAASAFAPSAPLLKAVLLGVRARAPRRRWLAPLDSHRMACGVHAQGARALPSGASESSGLHLHKRRPLPFTT